MAYRYSNKDYETILEQIRTNFANGVIELRSGAQPTNPGDAVSGTLIATVTESGGAWVAGSPTNGLNFDAVVTGQITPTLEKAAAEEWKFTAVSAGTIGHFRFKSNLVADNGTALTTVPRMDGSVGISTGDLRMGKVTYAIGETGVIQDYEVPLVNID